jgi:hypothetical protein
MKTPTFQNEIGSFVCYSYVPQSRSNADSENPGRTFRQGQVCCDFPEFSRLRNKVVATKNIFSRFTGFFAAEMKMQTIFFADLEAAVAARKQNKS